MSGFLTLDVDGVGVHTLACLLAVSARLPIIASPTPAPTQIGVALFAHRCKRKH